MRSDSKSMLSDIVYAFEAAHQRGEAPAVHEFVPADVADRAAVVAELVRIDVEYRRKRGLPIQVERYLTALPQLAQDEEALLDLIEAECRQKQAQGDEAAVQAVAERFPALAERLQTRLGTHATASPSPQFGTLVSRLAIRIPPELLDRPDYEVQRELGRGGMGVVYLARNKLTERAEALKVVNPRLLDEPGLAERFLREIRSAARLDHPNIVKAHTALRIGTSLVFVMEYVEGEDLASVVKTRGPLPVAEACTYACQVGSALQHAFEKGMVHRDIKPQNLILARDGTSPVIKILDFGLAKVTRENEETSHQLTGTGAMLGTPEYIAPDQMLDAGKADIRADIYSLGCTLYFLLTGAPPFRARSRFELLQAHHSQEATPLHQMRPDVPVELAEVVTRMMAKDPARRYQQPIEAVRVLTPFTIPPASPLPSIRKESGSASSDTKMKPGPDITKTAPTPPGAMQAEAEGHTPIQPAAKGRLETFLALVKSKKELSIAAVVLLVLVPVIFIFFSPWKKTPTVPHLAPQQGWTEPVRSEEWLAWRTQIHDKLSGGAVTEKTLAEALEIKPPAAGEHHAAMLRRDQAIADVLMSYRPARALLEKRFGIYEDKFLGTGLSKPVNAPAYWSTAVHEYLIPNHPDNHPAVWMRQLGPLSDRLEKTVQELIEGEAEQDEQKKQLVRRIAQAVKEKDTITPPVIRFARFDAERYSRKLGRPEAHRVFASNLAEVWNLRVKDAAHLSGYTFTSGNAVFIWAFAPGHPDEVVPATWGEILTRLPKWLRDIDARTP